MFLGELAAGAAALAAVACTPAASATGATSQAPKPAPTPAVAAPTNETPTIIPVAPKTWDASWMNRITAKHKAVFDSPEIGDGTALWQAMMYLDSVKDVFGTGDSDASVVVVLRHRAVPLLFNDAMWAKYDLAAQTKTMLDHLRRTRDAARGPPRLPAVPPRRARAARKPA